ncbi:hypothetical protein NDU88_002869 [Pleurodeles waltl]|uniref:Uncharacterized protein n=1 Tax=Pleurodeles waltl TaxID=8319 RepID=A0AAV7UAY5_PLEWA|nr:hypothetical protein NDU88_002869 [Pleurodeles waltl]
MWGRATNSGKLNRLKSKRPVFNQGTAGSASVILFESHQCHHVLIRGLQDEATPVLERMAASPMPCRGTALVSDHDPIHGRCETYLGDMTTKGTPKVFPRCTTDSILLEDADDFRGRDLKWWTSLEEEEEGTSKRGEEDAVPWKESDKERPAAPSR